MEGAAALSADLRGGDRASSWAARSVGGSSHLLQIAVARGDVESYLGQFSAGDLHRRPIADGVAQHLLDSGRAEQALEPIDGATAENVGLLDGAWHDIRMAVFDALDRPAEAQEMCWQWFRHTLSIPHLRDFLRRLDDFEDGEAEERSLRVAGQHPNRLLGLELLVAVVNMFSRHPLSWKFSNSLATEFCLEALEMALSSGRKPQIFYPDQGCQFTLTAFVDRLKTEEVEISWSGRRRCYENILVERLWPMDKYEEEYLRAYSDG